MANRYWVGGSADWDGTAGSKWATTSGGGGGATLPTSTDDVFFDAASGAVTVTIASGNTGCRNLDTTGYTGTLNGSAPISVYGNLNLNASSGFSYVGIMTFAATTTGKTITMNGQSTAFDIIFDGVGGGWTLQDPLNIGGAWITLQNGSFSTNNQQLDCGCLYSNNNNTRSLSLGSSVVNVIGSTNPIQFYGSNFTFNAGTSSMYMEPSGYMWIAGGGKTFYDVTFTGSYLMQLFISDDNTFHNLTIIGGWHGFNEVIMIGNQTVTGTLDINGYSATNRTWVHGSNNIAKTLTVATASLSYVDFTAITAAGAASPFTGTSIGNGLKNTNITFTTPVTRYWVGDSAAWSNTSSWSSSSGGAGGASIPLPQDTVIFDANSFSGDGASVDVDVHFMGKDITFAAIIYTVELSIVGGGVIAIDNLTLSNNVTISSSYDELALLSNSQKTFTIGGADVNTEYFTIDYAADYILVGNFELSGTALFNIKGSFDANDYDIATGQVQLSDGIGTLNMGAGTWELYGTGYVWFDTGATHTRNEETSTILISDTSSNSKTMLIQNSYQHYHNIVITGDNVNFDVNNNPTFDSLVIDTPGLPTGTIFKSFYTYNVGDFVATGTPGNEIIIKSDSGGSWFELSKGSGTVVCDYLSLQDSHAVGGATFLAGSHSTDVSGNSGWIFSDTIPPTGEFLLFFN